MRVAKWRTARDVARKAMGLSPLASLGIKLYQATELLHVVLNRKIYCLAHGTEECLCSHTTASSSSAAAASYTNAAAQHLVLERSVHALLCKQARIRTYMYIYQQVLPVGDAQHAQLDVSNTHCREATRCSYYAFHVPKEIRVSIYINCRTC